MPPELSTDSFLNGRYRILEVLGRGGMGVVYKALDGQLKEPVAVKVLRPDPDAPDLERRFHNEIRLARRVRHPHVCAMFDYGEDGDLRYIVMEYVRGLDFKDVLRTGGPLAATEAAAVIEQAALGLQAIHDAGVLHRDLKTPNLMRDEKGMVRVMDFGVAKEVTANGPSETASGVVVGTVEYMSPEQARADKLDARSDIYSLGIVFFELLTGDVPFRGQTAVATMMKHLSAAPRLEQIPPALVPILERALAKRKDERFASAEELVLALGEAMGRPRPRLQTTRRAAALSSETRPATPPVGDVGSRETVALFRIRPGRRAIYGISAGLLLAGGAAAVAMRPRPQEPAPPLPAATAISYVTTAPPVAAASVESLPSASATAIRTLPPATVTAMPSGAKMSLPAATDKPAPPPEPVTASVVPPPSHPTEEPVQATPAPLVVAENVAAAAAPAVVAAPSSSTPAPAAVTLFLKIRPSGAEIVVDGRSEGRVERLSLLPGHHRLVVLHPQYKPVSVPVNLQPGGAQTIKLNLGDVAQRID